jgi:hypothetical protein
MASVLAIACGQEEIAPLPEPTPANLGTTRQEVRSTNKVLILSTSVNGGINSPEAAAVRAFTEPDWPIDVKDAAQWAAMTSTDFMGYHAIIIGDAGCTAGTAAFQAAIENRRVWGPVIDGDVVILGTNPSSGLKPQLMRNGIEQIIKSSEQYRTGLYVSLGCAYQNAAPGTVVPLLDELGEFKVEGRASNCAATTGHRFDMHPLYVTKATDDAYLGRDACAARSVFTTYPFKNFAVAAIGLNAPGSQEFIDYLQNEPAETRYFGTPYILVRGAIALGAGCGGLSDYVPSGEECDLGDNGNGVPAGDGQPAEDTCSFSCRMNWCGDGVVDAIFGEQCDRGFYNGRSPDGNGAIVNGMCTKSCQLVDFPAPINEPPDARCKNVTVSAPSNACGAPANINDGSIDLEDGTNITCEQSPVGPYNIGNTTVTLTCRDSAGQGDSCTGIVTVRDITPPTVAVGTPNRTMECTNTTYGDLSDVTASDLCSNPLTNLGRTGSVNMRVPGSYLLTYSYRDTALNVGSANRTVNVVDTRVPTISLSLPTTMAVECATAYVEPGYSASDACYGDLRSSVVVDGTVNTAVLGSYSLYYRLTDPSGNVASPKLRTVTVRDTTLPTVTILGELNQTVECNDPAYQDPGAAASDTCAGTLTAVASPPPNAGVVGTQSIQYRATDPSGNVGTSTNSRTLTVVDTLPPVVTLNGAATMGLECATTWNEPGATARDQCAGNLAVTQSATVDNRRLGAQTINYTATDPQGRSDTKTRTVTVSDTVPPTVTPNGALSQTVECNDPSYRELGASVSEACDPTAPAAVVVNPPPVGTPGSYSVNYEATDRSGNVGRSATPRSVTVVDTLNPTVTLNGSGSMNLECASPWNDPGATANDQCSGPLAVTTSGTVDNRNLTTQTLTYSATDGAGRSDTKNRTVTVRDTQAPTVTLNGPLSQRVECNDPTYQDPGAMASDACDVPPPAAVAVNPPPVGNPGSYTVNYEARDRSGNVGRSATGRSVTVEDTLPPTLMVQGPNPQQLECGTSWDDPGATANDQCAGPLTPNRSGGVNHGVPADYTITYSVTDGRTPTISQTRTVNVRDTLPPMITVNGPTDQQFECGNTYVDPGASAADVCAGQVAVTATRNGDSTRPGDFTITYSARDPSGNEVTSPVVRTVHVNDNAPPTLALVGSGSQTVECATAWNDPGATANDACFGDLTAAITREGSVDNMRPALYPLTYRVTDPAGLSAEPVRRDVRVQDTLRPTVTMLGATNIAVECGDGSYRDPGASASDSCAGTLPAVPSTVADPNAPDTYVISYTATDPSGNVGTSSTSRTVTVSDTLNPVLTLTGNASMTLECATPWNDPGATANDQCAGNLTGLIQRTGTVNNMQPAPYRLTYSVTDPSGRSDSKERAVTVRDTLVPEITVQGPLTDSFECGQTYADPGATANDACAGEVPVTSTREGNPNQPGEVIIRYSAQDPSGNRVTSPVERRVTVNDNAPPTLVLLGSGTQSVECGTSWNDPGATANDACFGDLTASITREGSVRPGVTGSYPLTYRVTDPAGLSAEPVHRTVNVNDTLAPAITVLGPLTQSVQCNRLPYEDPGATAADQCAGNLTGAIVRTGSVNTGAAGSYTLSYRVADPSGNQTTAAESRTVTVVDDQAPSILLTGPANGTHECGSPYNDPGATANDACAGDLTAQIQRSGAVNGGTPGSYTLGYTVADPSGLTASTQRQVTVNDTLAPALALIGPATQNVECGPGYQDPGATATDACAGNLDAQIVVTGAANPLVVGNYNVSYAVADNVGNAASPLNREVRVRDTVAPNITVTGPLEQDFDCGDTYVDPGASATDVCAGNVAVTSTRSGNPNQPGTFTITYSAQDPSGNSVTSPVTRTVRVTDDEDPTLVLLGEATQTLECGSTWTDPGARANDACYGDLTAAITVSGSVNPAAPGNYPIIYNVTDGSGNSAPSVNRTVQVRDTVLPVITVRGSATDSYECGSTYQDPGATALDSCAGDLTSAIVATRNSDPGAPANFTITYSVADPSGNTAVAAASRTVTMNDNTPPSISLNGPATQVLECSRGTYDDPGAAANDLCVGPVPVTVVGSVNMGRSGTYHLRYSARDTAGNTSAVVTRDVTITDTIGPDIRLNGPNAVELECAVDQYTDLGATAEDICSGPSVVTVDDSAVNEDVPGAYLVRYTASDASGNTNSTVRNVVVVDNLPPAITLNGSNPMIMECATPFQDPGATANDLCQGDVSSSVFIEFNGVDNMTETDPTGQHSYYEVRYQARDRFGRSAFATRQVGVNDSIGPVLTVVGPPSAEIECGTQPELGVQAMDSCYGNVTDTVVASPATLPSAPGEYTVSYTARDRARPMPNPSSNTVTRTFTVVDTGVPEIVVNGPTEIYYECTGHAIGNVWNNPGATATDTCEGELLVHQYNSGDDDGDGIPGDQDPDDFGPGPTTEVEGLYYVQYLAWDESFNIQGAILSVYVQDTLPPMLFLNGEEAVQTQCFLPTDDPRDPDNEVEVDPEPYIDQGAIGDDQCYGDVTPLVQTFGEVNKQSPGVYTLEYQVRDGAFNWAAPITRTVEVIDNISPVLKEVDPLVLTPADSSMRTVELSECVAAAWDLCEGYLDINEQAFDLSVTSNDQNMDPGDVVIIDGAFQVRVRNNTDGNPRVYTARYKVADDSGNVVDGECTVNVVSQIVVTAPAHDSTTSDNTPTISGFAPAGRLVTVFVDGTPVGTAIADATRAWSFTPTAPLANGTHSVRATMGTGAVNVSGINLFTVEAALAPASDVAAKESSGGDKTQATLGVTEPRRFLSLSEGLKALLR